jgi:hypothetical protein
MYSNTRCRDGWGGPGSPMLLSVGKFVFILDKRVEVVEQPNTGDWILVIKVRNVLIKGTV